MKTFITLILGFITTFLSLSSWRPSPEQYEEEIRDCVKLFLAEAKYLSSNPLLLLRRAINPQYFDELSDQIWEIYGENSDMNLRDVLVCLANDESSEYQNDARKICNLYDDMQIDLSDYSLTYDSTTAKSWTFTELHSGVEFIFEIEISDDCYCNPIEESLTSYVERLVE